MAERLQNSRAKEWGEQRMRIWSGKNKEESDSMLSARPPIHACGCVVVTLFNHNYGNLCYISAGELTRNQNGPHK